MFIHYTSGVVLSKPKLLLSDCFQTCNAIRAAVPASYTCELSILKALPSCNDVYETSDPRRVLLPQPEPPPPPPPGGCPAIGLGGHRAPSCLSLTLLALYALALLPALALLARRLRAGAQNPIGYSSGGPGGAGRGGLLGRLRALLPPYGRSGGPAGARGTAGDGAAEPLLSGSAEGVGHGATEGGKGGGAEPWVGGAADAAGWEADEAGDEAFPRVERHLRRWFRKQARLLELLSPGSLVWVRPRSGFLKTLNPKKPLSVFRAHPRVQHLTRGQHELSSRRMADGFFMLAPVAHTVVGSTSNRPFMRCLPASRLLCAGFSGLCKQARLCWLLWIECSSAQVLMHWQSWLQADGCPCHHLLAGVVTMHCCPYPSFLDDPQMMATNTSP